jgi:hypothetical protein
MPYSIPSAALAQMSPEDLTRFLNAAFAANRSDWATFLSIIDARLRVFEHRYELPSSELVTALQSGALRDTAEVSQWLFWTEVRNQCARQARTESSR